MLEIQTNTVTMLPEEMDYITWITEREFQKIQDRGAKNQWGCEVNSIDNQLEAWTAEAAVAKLFDVYWDGGKRDDIDVGMPGAGVEVKWSSYSSGPNPCLILNPDDPVDATPYVRVIGSGNVKEIQGFIRGVDTLPLRKWGMKMPSKRPGWWIYLRYLDPDLFKLDVRHISNRTWSSIFV